MAQSIAVISGKGGAGKSFFCVNAASALAAAGERCLIIDTDSGMRSADIILRQSDRMLFDLSDLAAERCELSDAVAEIAYDGRLSLIAGAKDPDFVPGAEFLSALCESLGERFGYIFLDAPAGAGEIVRAAVAAADRVIIVTNPSREAALPAAAVAETAFRVSPGKRTQLVLNKVVPAAVNEGTDMTVDEIMDICYAPLLGIVYYSDAAERCRRNGKLLFEASCIAGEQLRNIAGRLKGEYLPLSL